MEELRRILEESAFLMLHNEALKQRFELYLLNFGQVYTIGQLTAIEAKSLH